MAGRWYLSAPFAIIVGSLFGLVDPRLLPVGAVGAIMLIWALRAYRQGADMDDPGEVVVGMGREAQDTTQAVFEFLTAMLVALFFLAEAVFGGASHLLGTLGSQIAGYPLPVAYWGTAALGALGIQNPGQITGTMFLGFGLMMFAFAVMIRSYKRRTSRRRGR